jgi:hypothetical protein
VRRVRDLKTLFGALEFTVLPAAPERSRLANSPADWHLQRSEPPLNARTAKRSFAAWDIGMFHELTRTGPSLDQVSRRHGVAPKARGILRSADGQLSEANPSGRGSSVGRARD